MYDWPSRSILRIDLFLFAAAMVSPYSASGSKVEGKLPDIVVIYADDLGYGDVACYNPQRGKIPTPNIDRLASQGLRFMDGHSSSGVCSPSRYTLLTGRYHWRTRLQQGIVGLWGAPLIEPKRWTLGSMLQQAGYRTACIGKWHLGWDWPIPKEKRPLFRGDKTGPPQPTAEHRAAWRECFSASIPGGPVARGFEYYFGTDVPNWPPYCFIEQDHTLGIPSQFLSPDKLQDNQASIQGPALLDWELERILPSLADRTCKFIADSTEASQPYFIYLALTSPHTPLAVNAAWKGRSGLNRYADFVMETDATVGTVMRAIEQAGRAENTLVVFTSDNGCAPYIGKEMLETMGHYPSGRLRGAKSDVWEGGHRVPFIVRWPARIAAGRISHQLVHQADLMATFAEIADVSLPDDSAEDSFSLMPLFEDFDKPIRDHAISQSIKGLTAIREGSWKLIFGPGSGGWGEGRDEQPGQLYDLEQDLGETHNRFAQEPERVEAMLRKMETIVVEGRSNPGPPQENDQPVLWRRFMNLSDTATEKAD